MIVEVEVTEVVVNEIVVEIETEIENVVEEVQVVPIEVEVEQVDIVTSTTTRFE